MGFHVIIPARFAASRLPGKPLLTIGDKPLVQWVWQRALASGAQSVLVATDDERIRAAALKFGECAPHQVGADRRQGVVHLAGWKYAGLSVERPLHFCRENVTGMSSVFSVVDRTHAGLGGHCSLFAVIFCKFGGGPNGT